MHIDWQSVVTTVGSGGTFMLAAAWLIRKVITEQLARDTEAFKAQVQASADMEVEKLKSSLQITATEHQVRFSKMHEKRAEVIEEVYKKLTQVYWDGRRFVLTSENNPNAYQSDQFKDMMERLGGVSLFIEQHRIFLPHRVSALLEDYFKKISSPVYAVGIFGRIEYPTSETAKRIHAAFTDAYAAFETAIPAAQAALEVEFRKILGAELG